MALRNLLEAVRAPWLKRAGLGDPSQIDYAYSSDFVEKWASPTSGGQPLAGMSVDTNGKVNIGGELIVQPMYQSACYYMAANGGLADQAFFIANQSYQVMAIYEIHGTAGNHASAVTSVVKKCPSGVTVANGTALMSSTFNMKGTANTLQTATLSTNISTLTLAAGDRLAIDYTGTLTTLAGVCVVVFLKALTAPTLDVTFAFNANAGLVDSQFFVANDRYQVSAVRYCHSTAGSDSGTVAVQLVHDTSTNAPGAGTDMLNTAFNCKSTANVPQTGSLVSTASTLLLGQGDRLSVDFAGTTTDLAGVVVTVSLIPLSLRTEVSYFYPGAQAANTDTVFFIADRDYYARISTEVHAVAAGGASTAQIVKDTSTDAPGAGTDLLLAAYDLNGTAQTVDVDLLAAAPYTVRLRAGDRLAIDFANAVQATEGVLVTVGLNSA